MSVEFKALIVVFTVSVAVLFFFYSPFSKIVGSKRYNSWAIAWLAVVSAVFLVPTYWLFMGVTAMLVAAFTMREPIKPAIFALLFAATPAYGLHMPGFLGINRFIETTPQTVLIAIVLVPALFTAKHMRRTAKVGNAADLFFALWLALQIVLAVRAPTFTHMLRLIVESFLAMAPLYYLFSRSPKSLNDMRIVAAATVLPMLILCATNIPETVMTWHYFTSVATLWVGDLPMAYKIREGALRATGSSTNPIAWGFLAMAAFGVALAFFNDRFPAFYKYVGFGLLGAGLILSLSRGPWIGAGLIVFFFVLTGPKAMGRLAQLGALGAVGTLIAAATPYGQGVISLLPIIGDSAGDTITYRQRLLDAAQAVIAENPVFGSQYYIDHPRLQAMRQGEGIIDIVNSYVQVTLQSGFVGLFIYLGLFLSVLAGLRNAIKSANAYDPRVALYCRAYLATLIGVMVTIFTTSIVEHMSYVIWSLLGGGVALARLEYAGRSESNTPGEVTTPAAPTAAKQFDWK